jgi:hypothetical protein
MIALGRGERFRPQTNHIRNHHHNIPEAQDDSWEIMHRPFLVEEVEAEEGE